MSHLLRPDTSYSSSELLQQAATHVLRSSEQRSSTSSSTTTSPVKKALTSNLDLTSKSSSLSSYPFLSDQLAKSSTTTTDSSESKSKLWFSILPKVPCDKSSITQPTKR